MMCDKFSNAYQISNVELGEIVGCSDRTIQSYILRLEEIGLLKSTRRIFDNKLLYKVYSVI
ncbi:HTH domain-containing protein [Paenibacillus agilis]|uniref:HTH domain-containing protein n=2 Tax=Paenibacillus agilis TaxID=3020863 RepID=A0A559IEN8_9BACL|nr:HTH domain-containing protein [Paenibacillus agilis]